MPNLKKSTAPDGCPSSVCCKSSSSQYTDYLFLFCFGEVETDDDLSPERTEINFQLI
jgi:hypothetical protein